MIPKNEINDPSDKESIITLPNVLYAGYFNNKSEWSSSPHVHDCAEIVLYTKGVGKGVIGGKEYDLKAGQALLLDMGEEHNEWTGAKDPLNLYFVGIKDFHFPPLSKNRLNEPGQSPIVTIDQSYSELENCFFQLNNEICDSKNGYKTAASLLACLIYFLITRNKPDNQKPTTSYSVQIKEYLDEYYMEEFTLEKLSKQVNINKYYLVHMFKKDFGVTPIEYLINKRIEQSKYYLKKTALSISHIAMIVGYKDQYYFSTIFKRRVGMSPSEYRKSTE